MEERTARRWFFLTWESTFSTTVCFEISTPGKLKNKTPLKYLPLLTCPPSKLSLKLQASPFLANREAWTTASQSHENGLRHRCLQIIKACFWPASFANTAPGQGWKHVELSDHVGISVDQLRLGERIKAPTACYLLLGWAANMHRTTQRHKPLGKAEKQLQPAHRQDLISKKLYKGPESWDVTRMAAALGKWSSGIHHQWGGCTQTEDWGSAEDSTISSNADLLCEVGWQHSRK